jgi:hypothetical protein
MRGQGRLHSARRQEIIAGTVDYLLIRFAQIKFMNQKEIPMRTRSLAIYATLITALLLALAVIAVAADNSFVGTWKMNLAKSKINSGPAPKREIVTFTAQDNGLKLVVDGIDSKGKAYHVVYAAKFDGKDYALTGFTDADTVAINRMDANTFYELFKKAGKQVVSARLVVSKAKKTLTRTTEEKNAKGQAVSDIDVYDKQ